jgi:probable rRNA maturation factor
MILVQLSRAKKLSPAARTRMREAAIAALSVVPRSHCMFERLKNETWRLDIHLLKPKEIQALNGRYRDKDKPTDVLSFPLWGGEWVTPERHKALGEIFICEPIARKQCKLFGNTPTQELERLVIHGTLHVLEFDHERSKADEKIMTALEKKAVKKTRA